MESASLTKSEKSGWIVVGAFFFITIAIMGTSLSFGVFFKSIQEQFGLGRATTASITSVYSLLCGIAGISGGWALDRYGPKIVTIVMGVFTGGSLLLTSQVNSLWQLFIFYSLLLAIGTGAAYAVRVSTISRWFNQNRGLAMGIAGSGAGLGPAVIAPLATLLISRYGWRQSYIIVGLIALVVITLFSFLLHRSPGDIASSVSSSVTKKVEVGGYADGLSLRQAWRTRSYIIIGLVWFLYASSSSLISTHLIPHATDINISAMQAAFSLGLNGIAGIAGQILMGRVSDLFGRKVSSMVCVLIQACMIFWLVWLRQVWMLYVFAIVYGFAFGGLMSAVSALISETFGLRHIGIIFGSLGVPWYFGAAVGASIGGIVYDLTSAYTLAFLGAATAMLIVTFVLPLAKKEIQTT